MRTKNKTSNTILWAFTAGLVVGLIGCGGSDGSNVMPDSGSVVSSDAGSDSSTPTTYLPCQVNGAPANAGKPCLPAECITQVDQSTGISWQYAVGVSTCNAIGLCLGSSSTMCGNASDNPCVGGGDAGAPHCANN